MPYILGPISAFATKLAPAANIGPNGITIDLSALDQVLVSKDNNTVSIGGGSRWGDVYTKLEPYGLAVCGGRVFDVGVGGLLLGGTCLVTRRPTAGNFILTS